MQWYGDPTLFPQQQEIRVFVAPVGSVEYVQSQLEVNRTRDPIPPDSTGPGHLGVLVVARDVCGNTSQLLVTHGVTGPGSEFRRAPPPECVAVLAGIEAAPDLSKMLPNLPLSRGGLGLSCAAGSRVAAHWSSWADCVHMFAQRHSEVAEMLLTGIDQEMAPCFQAVRDCAGTLREAGFVMPTWRILADTPQARDLQAEPAAQRVVWRSSS